MNRHLAVALMCLGASLAAKGDETTPPWLYPINPPNVGAPTVEGDKLLHLPGSQVSYTRTQLDDLFFAPDWYPGSHGPLPAVVARGVAPKVFACGYCHSPTGQGRPENASLAGLPADYIVQQVAAFKSGARQNAAQGPYLPTRLMIETAMNVTAEDVQAAASYFAAQTLLPRVRIVERKRVPKTHVAAWVYVADAGTRTEPLDGRMLELAPDFVRHELRDDHQRYLAYVPKGSLARGEAWVRSGVPSVGAGCVSCHGVELLGVGSAPPIAGRSPTYLLRQLMAMKAGTRAGAGALLMQPIVASMSLDDMVSAVAYAASLPPSSSKP